MAESFSHEDFQTFINSVVGHKNAASNIQFFLEQHPEHLTYLDDGGNNLLVIAMNLNDEKLFEYLISKGVSVTNTNDHGGSALHFSTHNHKFTQRLCQLAPALINSVNTVNMTPLMYAIVHFQPQSEQVLLEHGAEVTEGVLKCRELVHKLKNNEITKDYFLSLNEDMKGVLNYIMADSDEENSD